MSRIGNKIIPIAQGLNVEVKDGYVDIKGPKGEDKVYYETSLITVKVENGHVVVTRANGINPFLFSG